MKWKLHMKILNGCFFLCLGKTQDDGIFKQTGRIYDEIIFDQSKAYIQNEEEMILLDEANWSTKINVQKVELNCKYLSNNILTLRQLGGSV